MRVITRRFLSLSALIATLLGSATVATLADEPTGSPEGTPAISTDQSWSPEVLKEQIKSALPPAISDGLDFGAWVWLSYLHNDQPGDSNFVDAEFSLHATKSFNQRVAFTGEVNFLNVDGHWRTEVEQLFVSMLPFENQDTIVTIGKFNANFGIEPRDFWNRTGGTTSLLFGAQPQDLVGVMITQPLGETGVTLRPFVTTDFQGVFTFDQPLCAGLNVEYKPTSNLTLSLTNMVGPGIVVYEGEPFHEPYKGGAYGGGANVIGNWQGPHLTAERAGTLYFLDANLIWKPRPDLTLAAEYLLGSTGHDGERPGWSGFAATATFDINDQWSIFGRWSYLDDSDWLITGEFQRIQEASGGATYRVCDNVEIRGEYRFDTSNVTGVVNSVSIHLTMGF